MCTMMQVQGSNMMDSMGGNPAAAFWGARHPSWPATSHASHQGSNATPNQDPKVAEKLMTELQVRFPPSSLCLDVLVLFLVLNIVIRRLSYLVLYIGIYSLQQMGRKYAVQYLSTQQCFVRTLLAVSQTALSITMYNYDMHCVMCITTHQWQLWSAWRFLTINIYSQEIASLLEERKPLQSFLSSITLGL